MLPCGDLRHGEGIVTGITVFVLGAGNFGTCLSCYLGKMGHQVLVWDRSVETLRSITESGFNSRYLPALKLPDTVSSTTDLQDVEQADILLLTVPSHALREMLGHLKLILPERVKVVSTLKGLELKTGLFPRQITGDVLGDSYLKDLVVLSGPSFAAEIAEGHPTCVTVAGFNPSNLSLVQKVFHSPLLRVYTSSDPIGLEVAGAFKNVIAIAAGACVGLGLGENSKAALITRGLAEMMRFGVNMGANPLTFNGLGGVGDLFLTCSSEKSRNYTVGFKLGKGSTLAEVQEGLNSVVEGILTSKALYSLAQEHGVTTPIVDEVFSVLYRVKPVREAMSDLINRDAKPEMDLVDQQ